VTELWIRFGAAFCLSCTNSEMHEALASDGRRGCSARMASEDRK